MHVRGGTCRHRFKKKLAAYQTEPLWASPTDAVPAASYRQLIEYSPIPVAILDSASALQGWNAAFLNLLNLKEEPAHLVLSALMQEKERDQLMGILQQLRAGESINTPLSAELTSPSGMRVTVSMYLNTMQNGESDSVIVAYLVDTTEQKNLEMRFAHSQKMQAVGQLAGGIAHDFNNLLTAMIGFCDLLLMRHPAGDQSFADIMQIKQNANRAANLVRQLLAFSRRQTLQPKLLDMADVLAELSNLVRRLIGENIELKMIHGRDLGMVRGDQGQLEQVLINLAVNARDAMPEGGILSIKTSNVKIDEAHPVERHLVPPSEDEGIIPGDYVLVEVADNGHGMPAEMQQKIFEPFFSTKEVGSGTGLGLSTVYGIVKQTGGYIYVSSQLNRGTHFYLFFPRIQAEEVAAATKAEAETEAKVSADLTGKGTVLLVEDETPVRIFAARALRNKGYTVLEADSGENALEVMAQHGPEVEVIVTDVIMPGMNGPAMIEKVLEKHPAIKVIFISGYAEDIFVKSYGTERSFNFLAKPFTLKQLASKVKEVTQGKA